MQPYHRETVVGNPEKGNNLARESRSASGIPYGRSDQVSSSAFTQHLEVALSRAFERRLGKAPTQEDVNRAVNRLGGTDGSAFLQHVARVQEQLACLHSKLQKSQELHNHASDTVKDISAAPLWPKKRSLESHDNPTDPPRERKRAHLKRTDSPPHPSDPPRNGAAKSLLATPMSLNDVPVAPRSMRSDPRIPLTDSAWTQATVDSSPQPLDTDTKQPIQPDHAKSDPGNAAEQQTLNDAVDGDNGNDGDTKEVLPTTHNESQAAPDPSSGSTPVQTAHPTEPSPSVSTSHSEPESPLTEPDTQPQHASTPETEISSNVPASPATAIGAPPYFQSQAQSSAPPTPVVANVPGIWAIQVGKPSVSQTDMTFEVDKDTAISVQRWATRRDGFDPDSRHVVVSVVALNATAVFDAQRSVSQGPGGISPQDFALALRDLRPTWPDDGSLVLQLNADQPGEQIWLTSNMSADKPLDITDGVREGTNSLRIVQLKNMVDVVFAIYAAPPTPENLDAALEWEKQRRLFSFRQPRSRRLFE